MKFCQVKEKVQWSWMVLPNKAARIKIQFDRPRLKVYLCADCLPVTRDGNIHFRATDEAMQTDKFLLTDCRKWQFAQKAVFFLSWLSNRLEVIESFRFTFSDDFFCQMSSDVSFVIFEHVKMIWTWWNVAAVKVTRSLFASMRWIALLVPHEASQKQRKLTLSTTFLSSSCAPTENFTRRSGTSEWKIYKLDQAGTIPLNATCLKHCNEPGQTQGSCTGSIYKDMTETSEAFLT